MQLPPKIRAWLRDPVMFRGIVVGFAFFGAGSLFFSNHLIIFTIGSGVLVTLLGVALSWFQGNTRNDYRTFFDFHDFINNIRSSREEIVIYSTFSYLFLPEYEDKNLWNKLKIVLAQRLREERSVRVKILLLNPSSEAAKQRDHERQKDHTRVVDAIRTNLRELAKLKRDNPNISDRIEVKVYDILPRFQLHQVDNRVSVAFYPSNKPASQGKVLYLDKYDRVAEYFLLSFAEVWAPSDADANIPPIMLEEYMYAKFTISYRQGRDEEKVQYVLSDKYEGVFVILERPAIIHLMRNSANVFQSYEIVIGSQEKKTFLAAHIIEEESLEDVYLDIVAEMNKKYGIKSDRSNGGEGVWKLIQLTRKLGKP